MKKYFLFFFLLSIFCFFCIPSAYAVVYNKLTVYQNIPYQGATPFDGICWGGNGCCCYEVIPYSSSDSCTYTAASAIQNCFNYGQTCTSAATVGQCVTSLSYSPSSVPCPITMTNSVGGCNGTPSYCSTSPVYQKVSAFLGGFNGGVSEFGHFTTIGLDNKSYRCRTWYKNTAGRLYFMITRTSYTSINPQTTSACLDDETFTALMNTNCELGTGWAKPTGDIVNYRTGEKSNDGTGSAPEITPTTEVVGPTGKPLTEPTGIDDNKDGFDDITGQVIPPSGSGISDSDGDGVGEVEIKDPDPDEIPAVPVAPDEYDTDIEEPDKENLATLFDIIDASPFISIFTGIHIGLSGMVCSLSTEVYGSEIKFDFCDARIAGILSTLGSFLVALASIIGVISIFD